MKYYIGKSIKVWLLIAAIIVGMSGPASAIDPAQLLTLFFGGETSTLEMVDSLEMLDTLEMN